MSETIEISQRIDIFTSKLMLCPEQVKIVVFLHSNTGKRHVAIISPDWRIKKGRALTLCGRGDILRNKIYVEPDTGGHVVDTWIRMPGFKQCFYCDRYLDSIEYRMNEMYS